MLVGKHHIHGAKVFTPTGGTPARLDDKVNEDIWAWGLGDVLVIAVAWLAPGSGAADDDVRLEGVAGAEVLAGGGAETLEGAVGTTGRLAPLDLVKFDSILSHLRVDGGQGGSKGGYKGEGMHREGTLI